MERPPNVSAKIGDVLPDEPRFIRLLDTAWADREGPHDDLATPEQASAWLSGAGYAELPALAEGKTAEFRDLRNALRRLAAHQTGDTRSRADSPAGLEEAVRTVNRYARIALPGPRIRPSGEGGFERAAADRQTVDQVLSGLAREAVEALTPPTQMELRACMAPACVLYYVQDHPRRAWCSSACGNRARAARHYARTKGRAH